ncbi:MAG: secretin [Marinobacter sp.]|nr:secretin [Marinobacter sp.]
MNCPRISRLTAPNVMALFITFLLFLVSANAFAASQSRAYNLNQRPAADVAAQIRDLYEEVNVTVVGQKIVARGETRLLDEIGQIIQQLDVATAQLRISVQSRENLGGKRSGGGVNLTQNNTSSNRNIINSNTVTINAQSKTTRSSGNRERSLIVQDGQSAQVSAGQIRSLPFAARGGRNPAVLLQLVETRSGFVVTPRVISPQNIELSIMSFEQDAAALPGYDTAALMTIRQVQPGQWVSLGGVDRSESREKSGIVYQVNSSENRSSEIRVRVDILP